ncbi:MAG: EAL domain-containing protein [Georgfuchsia sp.]
MYLGFWRLDARKPALLLGVSEKCASEVSKSGLTAHIAVIDDKGDILAVNDAWRKFVLLNGADLALASEGANFLAVCSTAAALGNDDAEVIASAIRDITLGKQSSFSYEYASHSSEEQRWFIVNITHFAPPGPMRIVVAHENITIRKLAEERILYLARHDFLTDLPNRAMFVDRFDTAIMQAIRRGTKLALLVIDVDRLKIVNDSLGHEFGDQLLKETASRLTTICRMSDSVSRHGGDEFLMLLADIDEPNDAARAAKRILERIAQPILLGMQELMVTASIGIAVFPDNAADSGDLLKSADAALYEVKKAGRNNYGFYSEAMNARAIEQLTLEQDLRRAITNGELSSVFQPQIEFKTNRIIGFEALVRWHHPTLGAIPPCRIIQVAEDSGLIIQIGDWMLREACRQNLQWIKQGIAKVTVAVNVSAIQFRQNDYVKRVKQILDETGLNPAFLELELTENIMLDDKQVMIEKLHNLKQHGILLSLDDFGTGYSSLNYLRQFPIHRLKIDQSFVRDLPNNKDSIAITSAIVALGTSLGLRIIAEGVESAAQADFLNTLGCDDAQGYFYSKPMPGNEIAAWIRERAKYRLFDQATTV